MSTRCVGYCPLSIYFEVAVLDRKEDGVSRKEWRRFLGRFNNNTKQLFLDGGDFDALDLDTAT